MSFLLEYPEFREFFSQLKLRSTIASNDNDFWSCLDDFKKLTKVAQEAIRRILASELERIASDEYYEIRYWDIDQLIFDDIDDESILAIVTLFSEPEYLFNAVSHVCYGVVGDQPFEFRRYHMPANCNREVFDPNLRLEFVEDAVANPGEVLTMEAGKDVLDWHTEQPVVLVRFLSRNVESLQWAFDRESLKPWMISSSDPNATQLLCLANYLGEFSNRGSIEPISKLLSHQQHDVRWTAIKNIAAIDPDESRPHILKSLDDPHPHIRNAARKTLDRGF